MHLKRLLGIVFGSAILVSGCSDPNRPNWYARTWITQPPPITIDGKSVTPTKANLIRGLGEPTYVVEKLDGEICIWRNTILGADPGERWDFIVSFDRDGHFRPTDPDDYCGFCLHCGQDIRTVVENRCPACGQAFIRP